MKEPTILCSLIAFACLGLVIESTADQGIETPTEIWVDGPSEIQPGVDRNNPHVATDELGRRTYVWTAYLAEGGDDADVFMRRFDAEGSPLDNPIFVNTYTTNDQYLPRVAVASDGSFLVTYQSREPNLSGSGIARRVRSQLFDADGAAVGTELSVNSLSTEISTNLSSDVAALRAPDGDPGGYVVTWQSALTLGDDSSGWNIQARLISPDGTAFGEQFQVNSNTSGSQTAPNVTELADGGFLVVFREPAPSGILARRFDAGGQPVGTDVLVSVTYDNGASYPDAAVGWDGSVAVVWEDNEESGNGDEIRARLYDSNLDPLGPDFRVNELDTDVQQYANVADYGPKGFLVTWESDVSAGGDLDPRSIEARLITGHDTFAGPQVTLNQFTAARQQNAGAGGWYGRVAAAWYSSNGNNQTGSDVITGTHIDECLFCDDFEWFLPGDAGNLWRWTSTQGVAP